MKSINVDRTRLWWGEKMTAPQIGGLLVFGPMFPDVFAADLLEERPKYMPSAKFSLSFLQQESFFVCMD
jgi:hypothetical protein